ncbi:MAG: ABC transporter substrate-binding protein [Acetobacter sp.]|nr:ABC transporter substrate-binding protein [Bacteroides sp.]MCM1340258.1 ABC transporter substrate-binding protein [Acetobacter sp.]MCM1432792.1 ABC transporter substrate-binding protein [Clostridiales bacterium]
MNKLVKKITAVALSALMIGGVFAGCSSGENADTKTDENKTYTVGICQLMKHDALDKATQGFQDALKEKLGDKITFDLQVAGEPKNCTPIAEKFVAAKYDLIMANATPALSACYTKTAEIPIVATSITNFATALNLDFEPEGQSGVNVTGTHDLAPLEKQAEQLTYFFPDAKNVGIFYCTAEANSKYQADGMKSLLEAEDKTVTYYTFKDASDIQSVIIKAANDSDVIYIPTDNTAAKNGPVIKAACEDAKTPIIAGETDIAKNTNAVATFSIDFYDIGYDAGLMAYEILVNGKNPAEMNIQAPKKLTAQYNKDAVEKYGVADKVTSDYVEITE